MFFQGPIHAMDSTSIFSITSLSNPESMHCILRAP